MRMKRYPKTSPTNNKINRFWKEDGLVIEKKLNKNIIK